MAVHEGHISPISKCTKIVHSQEDILQKSSLFYYLLSQISLQQFIYELVPVSLVGIISGNTLAGMKYPTCLIWEIPRCFIEESNSNRESKKSYCGILQPPPGNSTEMLWSKASHPGWMGLWAPDWAVGVPAHCGELDSIAFQSPFQLKPAPPHTRVPVRLPLDNLTIKSQLPNHLSGGSRLAVALCSLV